MAEEFGITTESVRGKRLEDMFPPDVAVKVRAEFEKAFEGETNEFVNPLGGRYFKHFPQPVKDEEGRVVAVVGFISEVTNLVKAEQEIAALNAQLAQHVAELEQANRRLEAFSFTVSHDLRNPLSVVATGAKVLSASEAVPAREREMVQRMQRAASRMGEMIEDLLALATSRAEELKASAPVDLSTLARGVADELLQRHADRKVALEVEPGLHARADRRLLRVVLENLLSNAIKYTAQREVAHVRVYRNEEAFVVEDDGVGFDMADTDKLFVPFERLHDDAAFEGNGIGLSTVQRMIAGQGGRVWAEGVPGRGAKFFFSLPA